MKYSAKRPEPGRPSSSLFQLSANPRKIFLMGALFLTPIFTSLAAHDLRLPGLNYDECYNTRLGMELALGLPSTHGGWALRWGNHVVPLIADHPYDMNTLEIFLSAFVFKIGGVRVESLRLASIASVWAAILFFFGFCLMWFSPAVAFAAALLASTSPVMVLWGRIGFQDDILFQVLFGQACLFFFSLWQKRKQTWSLWAAFFFWGFGMSVSIKGLAYLVVVPVAYFLFLRRACRLSNRSILTGLLVATAALANPLIYNLANGFPTLHVLWDSFRHPAVGAVNNTAFLANFALRNRQFAQTLSGYGPYLWSGANSPVSSPWMPIFYFSSWVVLTILCFFWGEFKRRPMLHVVLFMPAMFLLLISFSPMKLLPPHLAILWPFPCLIVALGWGLLLPRGTGIVVAKKRTSIGAVAALLALVSVVSGDIRLNRRYYDEIRRTGGEGVFSDGIYGLADYLDSRRIRRPICLTWGVAYNVYVLTQGRVWPMEVHRFRRGVDENLLKRYEDLARDPENHFIEISDRVQSQGKELGYYRAFDAAVDRIGRCKVREAAIPDRSGADYFFVFRVADCRGGR